MKLLWEDRAWDDYLYWQGQDKKTLPAKHTMNKERGSCTNQCSCLFTILPHHFTVSSSTMN